MKLVFILLWILGGAVILVIAGAIYFVFIASTSNPRLPGQTLKIGETSFQVELANTTTTRMRGLSGRTSLGENEGMLFVFDKPGRHGFWMKDMNFALDFVWIRNDKVIGVTENVPPPMPGTSLFRLQSYYPPDAADQMLEINAGEARKRGIQAGQAVVLE